MKHILFMTNIPAPYTVDFFNDLGLNFDLTVVFERKNESNRDSSWSDFKALNFSYIFLDKYKIGSSFFFSPDIIKILRGNKFDLCIVGNYSSFTSMLAINWMRHNGSLYAIHADGGIISSDQFLKFHIKKFLIQGADLYFSSGKITTEYFVHYGAERNKIYEYPFSSIRLRQIKTEVNIELYRKKLGLSEKNIIVSVGQIIPRKGHDILIKAISLLKTDVKLYIIGGKETEDLCQIINELHLTNIEFISFVPFKTVLDYIAAADLFVLLTREDIWGLVINEALAMGTPIISTDKCVAAVEIIRDGENGYVVESENPRKAAEKIDYLLNNKDVCRRIRENNIKKAKEYTIEKMTEIYSGIIDNYIRNKIV